MSLIHFSIYNRDIGVHVQNVLGAFSSARLWPAAGPRCVLRPWAPCSASRTSRATISAAAAGAGSSVTRAGATYHELLVWILRYLPACRNSLLTWARIVGVAVIGVSVARRRLAVRTLVLLNIE